MRSNAEESLALMLKMADLPFVREYRFAKSIGRKYRFDFANPIYKLAIEVEGGIWGTGRRNAVKGAHTRGAHFTSDCEKYNLAAELGWRVFRFTPKMVKDGTALATIERLVR